MRSALDRALSSPREAVSESMTVDAFSPPQLQYSIHVQTGNIRISFDDEEGKDGYP